MRAFSRQLRSNLVINLAKHSGAGTAGRLGQDPQIMAKAGSRTTSAARRKPANRDSGGAAFDDAFIKAVTKDFRAHGLRAITAVREEDPTTYMKLCASILTKSAAAEPDPLESLSDDQLIEHARELAAALGVAAHSGSDGSSKPEG